MGEDHQCSGNCSSCNQKHENDENCKIKSSLSRIRNKIVVMSGKGGVGKSTVAANLAISLSLEGRRVGLLDIDIHGPSVPKMLGLENRRPDTNGDVLYPVDFGSMKVMSIGFLLETTDSPVVWRGPVKIGVIQQFLGDVEWGDLDFLIVDAPPGTGDEPLTICQTLMGDDAGAVIVTTPQDISATDVSKSLNFCKQLGFKVHGIIENMSGFVCPCCGKTTDIFQGQAGSDLAKQYGVPFLGKIPVDPSVCKCGDSGQPFVRSGSVATANAFREAIKPILSL